MFLAGVGDRLVAVPLGDHHHRAAVGLQLIDIAVHAAGRGRAEGAGSFAGRGLGRAGVVDRVFFEIIRQRLAAIHDLLELGVGDVAADDDGAV